MAIRGFMAASLDGFVADAAGGVGFLEPFQDVECGMAAFLASITTVVMGRGTFEQILSFGVPWPYPGKRAVVVTSRPLADAAPGAGAWHAGLPALAAHLRAPGQGDAWIVGGPGLQAAMLELGALDRLDLFLVPVLLGGGVRLFPPLAPRGLSLLSARPLDKGLVHLAYAAP